MICPPPTTPLSRRELLARLGKTILAYPLLNMTMVSMSCGGSNTSNPGSPPLSDDQFLDEIERAIFLYFWEQASSITGQVKDRAFAAGNDTRTVSSIAATGFGLTALCIADQRGYMASSDITARGPGHIEFSSEPDAEPKRLLLPFHRYEYWAEGEAVRGFFNR